MKKTLVALFALGCLAFGEDTPEVLLTTSTAYGTAYGEGEYEAISFVLSSDSSRLTTTSGLLPVAGAATLVSIEVADSVMQYPMFASHVGKYAILTDGANIIVGYSRESLVTKTKHLKDWGWDYTRAFATYTGFQDYDGNALTLTIGKEYHVYFATEKQIGNIQQERRGLILSGDRVSLDFFTATDGKMPAGTENQLGFISDGMRVDTAYAPLVGVKVAPQETPEPATGTLGLLALCALVARRRKR